MGLVVSIEGIGPAEINIEGVPASSVAYYGMVYIPPAATVNVEGVPAVSVTSSGCELVLVDPSAIYIAGIPAVVSLSNEIVATPASIEVEGVVPEVAHWVESIPATISIEGVPAVSISASGFELVLASPAGIEVEGVAPGVFMYESYTISFPPAGISVSGIPAASFGAEITIIPASIEVEGIVPLIGYDLISNPAGVSVEGVPAQYVINISAFELFLAAMPDNYPAVILYRCYLTGSPDLILPISSFQSRIRDNEPTYLEVVVPNALDYIDEIAARATGEIVIEKGLQYPGGTSDFLELVRVAFEVAPYDLGATNKTIRLSGHKTVTNTAPKTTSLRGVSGESLQADGKRRIRCAVDFLARAGDTVTWNDGADSMSAGMITLTVSVMQQTMDITEA